jgi:hypothetical protein
VNCHGSLFWHAYLSRKTLRFTTYLPNPAVLLSILNNIVDQYKEAECIAERPCRTVYTSTP